MPQNNLTLAISEFAMADLKNANAWLARRNAAEDRRKAGAKY